ncbi:secondary thiamine-phosphate synthase enzyme YjbQ [Rhodospirillaceae bacterium SYSU D60014]|uniref:secondary thiamine-phosphate synthase enzyme YjbQ n=1 Tax=Virgifigura deserti TaxID=2268457 RepID=UPI000E671915
MRQIRQSLSLSPGARGSRQGLHEITGEVAAWLSAQSLREGLLTLFLRHTSASILIQENADPDVRRDLEAFFRKLVPEDTSLYRHTAEGPDDMPAHIRTVLTQTQLSIPVGGGKLLLGTWQGIYLFENRHSPDARELILHFIGE